MTDRPRVAFVQDHLVQRGGAERGLLSMLKAAPGAPVYAPFYNPPACYPEFRTVDIRTHPLDRIGVVRRHHRAALPLLPAALSRWRVDAEVVVCGTSGWAQGVPTDGRKVVYFYALPRWLYEAEAYLKSQGAGRRVIVATLRPYLERWDRRTVSSGDRFVTMGTAMRSRLQEIYQIDAEIVPLPNTLDVTARQEPVAGVDAGFFLCPSRLMPYKNVDAVVAAFASLPTERLVVAGGGPLFEALNATAPPNVRMHGVASDRELRWLYANCSSIVSAAYEPFGLTPVEAAAFGRPSIVLRSGGFLDTVEEDSTGVFFETPTSTDIADAVRRFRRSTLDPDRILRRAERYAEPTFVQRVGAIIDDEAARA